VFKEVRMVQFLYDDAHGNRMVEHLSLQNGARNGNIKIVSKMVVEPLQIVTVVVMHITMGGQHQMNNVL
jgi:hypothetical protein